MAAPPRTEKGLLWSREKATKAQGKGKFIYVRSDVGDVVRANTGERTLSAADKTWKKNANKGLKTDDVYLLEYRIVGTPADIRRALLEAKEDPNMVQAALNRAITVNNFEQLKNSDRAVMAEIAGAARHRGVKAARDREYSNITADTFLAIMRGEPQFNLTEGGKDVKASSPSRRTGQPKKSLAERLRELPAGKVLDVTAITQEGAGAKVLNEPKADRGSTKQSAIGPAPYNRLVSTNRDNMIMALTHLGAPASVIEATRIRYPSDGVIPKRVAAPGAKGKKKSTKSPKGKKAKSPKRATSATRTPAPAPAPSALDVKSQAPGPLFSASAAAPPFGSISTAGPGSPRGGRFAATPGFVAGGAPIGFNQSLAPPPGAIGAGSF